jgi:hypothetical protein
MPNELDDSELRGPRNEGPLLTLMRVPVVKSGTRQKWKLRLPVRNILTRKLYGWGPAAGAISIVFGKPNPIQHRIGVLLSVSCPSLLMSFEARQSAADFFPLLRSRFANRRLIAG